MHSENLKLVGECLEEENLWESKEVDGRKLFVGML